MGNDRKFDGNRVGKQVEIDGNASKVHECHAESRRSEPKSRRIEALRPCQALFVTFVIATFNFWVVAWSTDGPTTWLESRPVKRLLEVANRLVYSLYDAIIAYK